MENKINPKCDSCSKFHKTRLDLLNWSKSELKQTTSSKMDKIITPYMEEKIKFLNEIIKKFS